MTTPRADSTPTLRSWAVLVGGMAALAIAGALLPDLRALHYVTKPLATLLVALMVWRAAAPQPDYRRAALAGLLLSTLGDVWLMLPWDAFVAGLASFLVAHLAYLFAFTRRVRLQSMQWPFLAYAMLAAAVLALLWPRLPDALHVPVVVYVVALAAMAAQAAVVALQQPSSSSRAAALGGFCFVVSDALLAIDRFHTPLPLAPLWVLASYWIAQFLIGRSVGHSRA